MANVEHSTLTTTNLHENKGVSTATDNTVATAITGATVWAKLTAANLTGTGNSFGAQLLHVRDSVTNGTGGQALTTLSWNTRRLQTVVTNEIASASLGSNQITLPSGTYFIEAKATWHTNGLAAASVLRLRNMTDSATLALGQPSQLSWSGSGITVSANLHVALQGRFTIAGTKTIELQNFIVNSGCTGGLALGSGSGENEVFADVTIWKVL